MRHEAPPPERYRTPEGGLFNVAAMTDEEVFEVNAALREHFDYLDENYFDPAVGAERHQEGHNLTDRFTADIRGLAAFNPERVRGIVAKCMQSGIGSAHLMAVETAGSLIGFDYAFARDTLIDLYDGTHPTGGYFDDRASEEALFTISRLMRDNLTPQQIDDFNALIVSRGGVPLEPADPGSPY
jgi:hypothetical protein